MKKNSLLIIKDGPDAGHAGEWQDSELNKKALDAATKVNDSVAL